MDTATETEVMTGSGGRIGVGTTIDTRTGMGTRIGTRTGMGIETTPRVESMATATGIGMFLPFFSFPTRRNALNTWDRCLAASSGRRNGRCPGKQ